MQYGAKITIWREVPNSKRGLTKISKRQPNYLTSEILFLTREHQSISPRNRLMFCLLYGLTQSDKNTHKDDM
jgi:hypothetical protein